MEGGRGQGTCSLHSSVPSLPVLLVSWTLSLKALVPMRFPGKESNCNAGVAAGAEGSIPGSGRFPGEGNDNQLQYSCLENPMDRGA